MAAKIAVKENPDTLVVYCDTRSEHPDNDRFLIDVQDWIDTDITVLRSDKYRDTWHVWESKKYLSGVQGAPCTLALKVALRHAFERPDDIHIYGFTSEEVARATRFEYNNPELNCYWPLIEHGIDKATCLSIIDSAGIEIPELYKLGYPNNNCVPCCKAASLAYWNKIKIDFPEQFNRMAKLERAIGAIDPKTGKPKGAAINKRYKGKKRIRVFLDELTPDMGRGLKLPDISCGLLCQKITEQLKHGDDEL